MYALTEILSSTDENEKEENIVISYLNEYKSSLSHGYAVVIRHCRGRGKSDGDCIPYINEREYGLDLQQWIRKQSFYNGEIFLKGKSYLTSVNYVRHTNQKGLYSEQVTAKVAHNTVYLQESFLTLPAEMN